MSSIRIRTKRIDGKTQIRTLITHPMEHGRNIDKATNQPIPAHFIQELTVKHNDKVIANCAVGAGVSKDPYFAFMLKGGEPGDKITISWVDNLGQQDSEEHIIK
ncbi:thiosulfate oxidation carrier complex protein SoxZ [Methylobacter sp. YRD-M1]|uniref:thiosulfate oxidation carrier complex protein SoxZ n=1 Tax=Methylobacter sp. YRD-M1 TaxID=2911520 RepID=UPI002279FE9F|nr:thiosulfate oxidation carrier complex protein SoxZ [Methylobacter sp. YRD-M1]WAK03133.1 thiosulfate oxidation carrier complex protein SoxZ [Methylobacter sp. YRD-M1]